MRIEFTTQSKYLLHHDFTGKNTRYREKSIHLKVQVKDNRTRTFKGTGKSTRVIRQFHILINKFKGTGKDFIFSNQYI